MAALNKVTLIGRVGGEPQSKGGTVRLGLATSEKYKDKNGQNMDRTEWHNLVFFARLGEIATQYLGKGSLIYVEGRLQTSKWQNSEGKDQYKTEIIVNNMQMLGSKGNTAKEISQPASSESSMTYDYLHIKNSQQKNPMFVNNKELDEDLPF